MCADRLFCVWPGSKGLMWIVSWLLLFLRILQSASICGALRTDIQMLTLLEHMREFFSVLTGVEMVVMDMGCSQVCGGRSLTTPCLKTIACLCKHTPNIILLSLLLPDSLPSNLLSWMKYQQVSSNPDIGIRHRGKTSKTTSSTEIPQKWSRGLYG